MQFGIMKKENGYMWYIEILKLNKNEKAPFNYRHLLSSYFV